MIDLSIVIPSFETRALLVDCLESVEIARCAAPNRMVEVIVVENGSQDGSAEAALAAMPDLRLFGLARNVGFARAANVGLRASRGRTVLLLNSDVRIDADLLARAVELMDANPSFAVLGAALRHSDGRRQRSVHPLPTLASELVPEIIHRRFHPSGYDAARAGYATPLIRNDEDQNEEAREQFENDLRAVDAVRGAVFLIRAAAVEKIGLFDEGYFFFLEETDYCARASRAGYRVGHSPSLGAVHALGASSKARDALATRIEYHRSLYRYLRCHHGHWVAGVAKAARALRGGTVVLGLTLLSLFSDSARKRLPERAGLWLWHLRGCPPEPRLGSRLRDALEQEKPREVR